MATKEWLADSEELLMEIDRIYDLHYSRCNNKTVHDIFNAIRRRIRRYSRFRTDKVVRCIDCRWRKEHGLCYMISGCGTPVGTGDDFYCAYGKAKK